MWMETRCSQIVGPATEERRHSTVLDREPISNKKQLTRDHVHIVQVLDGDDDKMRLHLEAYVEERTPLADSAISLGGKSRSPTHSQFSPIGHISLDSVNSSPELGDRSKGLYSINTFYISRALQSSGIGRAAMDEVEAMAQREPLNAKTLALLTVANDFPERDEKLKAQGKMRPPISLQDWYERRGYVVFKLDKKAWEEEDLEGKMWPFAAVFMRKQLGAGKG